MKYSNEKFSELVDDARDGKLQLPAFQRDWKWERGKVIALYDSIRKGFPIGGLLLLETSPSLDLGPRLFEGADREKPHQPKRLVLDGQQRITAGIALKYGLGKDKKLRYFIDIKKLKDLLNERSIDLQNDEEIKNFCEELDDGDGYIVATTKQASDHSLLMEKHLLATTVLGNRAKTRKTIGEYIEKHPEEETLARNVIEPFFVLSNSAECPTTNLTDRESLTVVTRIFSTLNSTGKKLTPIEIVTALLFAGDINLKKEIAEFREASNYVQNMDSNGEILLQTVALLAGKSPKKALLPKTITIETFKAYYQDAFTLLDELGQFLSDQMGAGLEETHKLLPYDAILAPMAIVFNKVKSFETARKAKAYSKLKRWFVGAALTQRYQEGVHNKQESDARQFSDWVANESTKEPSWLTQSNEIPNTLKTDSPNGARGKLLLCLINQNKPEDPISGAQVGFFGGALEQPQNHHVWAKKFCQEHISDWEISQSNSDLALNIIPITGQTNRKWDKMNPSDQCQGIRERLTSKQLDDFFRNFLLSIECFEIMEEENKKAEAYERFIEARFRAVSSELSNYGFKTK